MSDRITSSLVVVSMMLAACGGSDAGESQELPVAQSEQSGQSDVAGESGDSIVDTVTSPTTAPTIPAAATTTTTTSPEAAASSAPTEAVKLREGITLTSGWTYTSTRFDIPFEFTIPQDTDGRFRVFQENQWSVVSVLNVSPRNPDVRGDQQPGVQLATVPDDVGIADIIDRIVAFGDEHEDFEVEQETGLLRGNTVTILRGTTTVEGDRTFSISTSEESFITMAQGVREFIMFVIDVDGQPVVAVFNADPLEFDLIVKNGSVLLETITFL